MNKALIVARHELATMLSRTGFLVMTALVPVGMLLLVGGIGAYVFFTSGEDDEPESRRVGYVDLAGVISEPGMLGATEYVPIENEDQARAAVASGEIDAAYVIGPDYISTGRVVEVVRGGRGLNITGGGSGSLREFLRINLVAEAVDDARAARILSPVFITTLEVDEGGQLDEDSFDPATLIFFMAMAFAVIFSVLTITGYLLQGLNEEKENRVMEILLSTVSPDQLMLGKLLGLGVAGMIQMGVWMGSAVGLLLGASIFVDDIPTIGLPPLPLILVAFAYFLLGYAFFAALMAALGAVTTSQRESQQLTVIVILPAVAPFWFSFAIIDDAGGILPQIMTYIPFTAPTMSLARLALDAMGPLEIAASLIALTISVVVAVKLAQRLFRSYLLVYGHRPPLVQLLRTAVTGRV